MEIAYPKKYNSSTSIKVKGLLVLAIVVIHLLIFQLLSVYKRHFPSEQSRASRLVYISPVLIKKHSLIVNPPDLNATLKLRSLSFITPPDFIVETKTSALIDYLDPNLKPYLSQDPSASGIKGDFSGIFDPRIRKQLAESNQLIPKLKSEKYKTTYLADGRMMVELGNGECIVSMHKFDNRERGTTWSTNTVRCGKTDSEKFMDNVQRDLDERRGKRH